jgi:adenylate kinase family enzyme
MSLKEFPWLPLETVLDQNILVGKLINSGEGYQLLSTKSEDKVIFIFPKDVEWACLSSKGLSQLKVLRECCSINKLCFGDINYYYIVFNKSSIPVKIESLIFNIGSSTSLPLLTLANSIIEMDDKYSNVAWGKALFFPKEKLCLAIEFDEKENKDKRHALATRILAGAIEDVSISAETIKKINSDLAISDIRDFLEILGFKDEQLNKSIANLSIRNPQEFKLPGRPDIEEFFKEHVIDYFYRYNEYKAMGIKPPNGILLHGPPGTGKTHTVKALADFLQWKIYDIDIGSVGSAYIHQTSKQLKEVFEKAANTPPSIVLMEEIDALAGSRSDMMHDHKIEEIAQLLRLIETASHHGILVIATTNRFHSMDSAIVRRGRFDHIIEMGFPKKEEIASALKGMFKGKPISKNLNLEDFSILFEGYAMSDISWVVNESARLAVKNKKDRIDEECLNEGIARLKKSSK